MINPTGQRKRNIRCPVAIFILILLPKQDIVGSSPITRSLSSTDFAPVFYKQLPVLAAVLLPQLFF